MIENGENGSWVILVVKDSEKRKKKWERRTCRHNERDIRC